MSFPYNDQGQPNTHQAILAGVADISANGNGFLRVSTMNAGGTVTFNGDASNNRVSSFQGDAGLLRVSAIGVTVTTSPLSADSSRISAVQGDAGILRVSGRSDDAGLFRVSSIGGSGGLSANQSISAVLLAGTANIGYVSAVVDNGSISAKSGDANQVHVSALNIDSASNFRVSAFSNDGGLFRVSSIIDNGSISARSGDANQVHVSAVQGDAGLLHTSSFIDSGSVSAKQSDAGNLHVSAYQTTAANLVVSAAQSDASILRVSSFGSVVTGSTGGASLYYTSTATTSQVSTIKSSGGRLYGYHLGNPAGVDQYVQIFNASAGATAGTDAPTLSLYVPTLGGAVMSLGDGIAFSAGMQFICTSTAAGQTVGASGVRANFFYA